jgi:hypothetical protein
MTALDKVPFLLVGEWQSATRGRPQNAVAMAVMSCAQLGGPVQPDDLGGQLA